jgi:hypothetical protein
MATQLAAVAVDTGQGGSSGLQFVDVDVATAAGVGRDQVGGRGLEGDKATIEGYSRELARVIRLAAGAIDANARGRPSLPVMHENVTRVVGVAGHQVGSGGPEGDEVPATADGRRAGASARHTLRLTPGAGDTDPFRIARSGEDDPGDEQSQGQP